jgi:hypothetical protein
MGFSCLNGMEYMYILIYYKRLDCYELEYNEIIFLYIIINVAVSSFWNKMKCNQLSY